MGKLFIAEKPSLAKAIYSELGVAEKGNGYMLCKDGSAVTWCFGHLLEQAEPDEYVPEEGRKFWRAEDLPIFPREWILHPKTDRKTGKADPGVKKQLKLIQGLLKKATSVVNAGDPDREGQLLVDEVLLYFGNKKPVERFWASAIDPASIRKALQSLKPNEQFVGMRRSALARSRADWLLGMNLSRAYTLAQPRPAKGQKTMLIAVGRVQTPTLRLVAQRDYAINHFVPVPFLSIFADCSVNGSVFTAKWQPRMGQKGMDPSGKLLTDFTVGRALVSDLMSERSAQILSCDTKPMKTAAPRPFSLADIQVKASAAFGFTAEHTLEICQSLYEKHKVQSYPRTDCQFLPESQFAEAPKVLEAIAKTCPALQPFVAKADLSIRSSAWNDKKITAHHGMIPTTFAGNFEAFTKDEQAVYLLVAKRYIAQFYPPFEYLSTKAFLKIAQESFAAEGKVVTKLGWRTLYAGEKEKDDEAAVLPAMKAGMTADVVKVYGKEDKTKPPAAYTEGKLIEDMESIHKAYADYPQIQAKLKETNGIGTPATRAAIIAELKKKGYLELKAKKLHVTGLGLTVLSKVSQKVSSAIMTAQWEEKLKAVEKGEMSVDFFTGELESFLLKEMQAVGIGGKRSW